MPRASAGERQLISRSASAASQPVARSQQYSRRKAIVPGGVGGDPWGASPSSCDRNPVRIQPAQAYAQCRGSQLAPGNLTRFHRSCGFADCPQQTGLQCESSIASSECPQRTAGQSSPCLRRFGSQWSRGAEAARSRVQGRPGGDQDPMQATTFFDDPGPTRGEPQAVSAAVAYHAASPGRYCVNGTNWWKIDAGKQDSRWPNLAGQRT
jgi:hypothetical protein